MMWKKVRGPEQWLAAFGITRNIASAPTTGYNITLVSAAADVQHYSKCSSAKPSNSITAITGYRHHTTL